MLSLFTTSYSKPRDKAPPGRIDRPGLGGLFVIWLALFGFASAAEAKKPKALIAKVAPVSEGAAVTLNGGSSLDPEGSTLKYAWTQISGLPSIEVNGAETSTLTFKTPPIPKTKKKTKPAKLAFQLTVTDGEGLSAIKKTVLTVKPLNAPPVANAGADQSAVFSQTVTLTSLSTDPDAERGGQIIKYQWKQLKKPGDPKVKLINAKTRQASFVSPAVPAQLEFQLTVTDNDNVRVSDNVIVSVTETATVPGKQALDAALNVSSSAIVKGGQVTAQAASIGGGAAPYTVAFNWGDGSANEQETLVNGVNVKSTNHTYAVVGTYDLTITVTDNAGGSKVQTFQITVSDLQTPALSGTLSLTQPTVVFNTPVQAKVDITGGTAPYAVKFEWGDGQATGPKPLNAGITSATGEHFYGLVGSYTITATITDANGGTKIVTTNVTVNPVDAPLTECQTSGGN